MSNYDLEEQEQLAELKAFWKKWGTAIVLGVVVAAAGFAGLRMWQSHQGAQSAEAVAIYGQLQQAAGANDVAKVREAAGKLIEGHPRSLHAALGALIAAKVHFESGDLKSARAQLQWVIEHANDAELQAIARLRLATVMLDEKAYDEALKVLSAKPPAPFQPLFDAARGDVLVAQGKIADARAAYRAALAQLKPEDVAARDLVQMKLDGLSDG
jgi:predicted negative regulator of RcsB-dependent stress response